MEEILEALNSDPNVEYAEPNYVIWLNTVPNDPFFYKSWGLNNTGQTGGKFDADIDASEAWVFLEESANFEDDIVVALIDSGVNVSHPGLLGSIWVNPGEIPNNGVPDDDGNGVPYDFNGFNAVDNNGDVTDYYGHGTPCAGIIAAVNNNIGRPGDSIVVKIMPIKFIDIIGQGRTSNLVKSIMYAINMDADVISLSLGGLYNEQILYDSILAAHDAGILVVISAGNSNSNNDIKQNYPSSYNLPNIIAVGATDHNDCKTSYSCWGEFNVDIFAPGECFTTDVNGGYRYFHGTSAACPYVAGSVAMIKQSKPHLTAQEMKDLLLVSVDPIMDLKNISVSGGRLNLYNALVNDVPPAKITDLFTTEEDTFKIKLRWTSVGDNSAFYDIRYSTKKISNGNWNDATQVIGVLTPNFSGAGESFVVENLKFGTKYFFAIKVVNQLGKESGLSNTVSGSTTIPAIAFSDDIEKESGWNVSGLWHKETYRASSPISSFGYNNGGPNYTYNTTNSNFGNLTSSTIDLSEFTSAILVFDYFYQTEDSEIVYAQRKVQVGIDGVFTDIVQLSSDPMMKWNTYIHNISSYAGEEVQIRFNFGTNGEELNNFEGWYIDDVSIVGERVEKENIPPVANAGPDQIVNDSDGNGMEIVTLNATGSYDLDGCVTSVAWGTGTKFLGFGYLLNYNFSVGTHNITLSVKDDNRATVRDEIIVTVNPNQVPAANAGPDQTSFIGEQVLFNGSNSSDPDGEIVTYEWNLGDESKVEYGTSVNHSFAIGNYTVELTVMDNGGASAKDSITVEIVATDVVKISMAQYDNEKKIIIFQAKSSDGGEAVLKVFRTSDDFYYGQMEYTDRDLYLLKVDTDFNPKQIIIRSSLGGECIKEVTNKYNNDKFKLIKKEWLEEILGVRLPGMFSFW